MILSDSRLVAPGRSMPSVSVITTTLAVHWSAWWEHEPQVAFGGASPAEAVDWLVGFNMANDT